MIPAVRSYCLYLGHANSALNPIVYCFMTRNFRRSVAGLICGNRRHYNRSNSVHNVSLVIYLYAIIGFIIYNFQLIVV